MDDVGAKHPWLFNRNGKWYLRARVPKDVLNHPKAEIKRSLGTSEFREACRLIHAAAANLEQEFEEYRRYGRPPPEKPLERISRIQRAAPIPVMAIRYLGKGPPPSDLRSSEDLSDAEIRAFAAQAWREWQSWIMGTLASTDTDWLVEHVETLRDGRWKDYLRPLKEGIGRFSVTAAFFLENRGFYCDTSGINGQLLGHYLLRAGNEAYRRKIERISGVVTDEYRDRFFDDIPVSTANQTVEIVRPHIRSATGITLPLKEIIKLYENDPDRRHIRQKTRNEDKRTFIYMIEHFGADCPIDKINRNDCIAFRDAIRSIPVHAYRDFNGLNFKQLQTIVLEQGTARLSNKGANKYLDKLSAVMNFAKDRNFISVSQSGLQASETHKAHYQRSRSVLYKRDLKYLFV